MRIVSIGPVLIALLGGALGSQLPEFTQQYRQRLGGALVELNQIVADFDRDATGSGLTRGEAIEQYSTVGSEFLNARGKSVASTVARRDALRDQSVAIEASPPLLRPLAVLRDPDQRIMDGVWHQYEPAIPVTAAGIAWGGLSAFVAWLFASIVLWPITRRRSLRIG